MIGYIEGKLSAKTPNFIVIDIGVQREILSELMNFDASFLGIFL